ncbi:MAG: PASTA domain-containing protein [Chthoniobacterales bacterium]
MPNRPQLKKNQHALRVLMVPLLFLLSIGWNISARADQVVYLTVSVTDQEGNNISGARVNVYQQEATRSSWADIPVPPDYQEDTNAQGLARLQIKVATGQDLDVTVEVSREDKSAESHRIKLKNFPTRLPLEKFVLKKKSEAGAGPTINVTIVAESEGKPLEAANVLIRDSSLGAVTGRFTGTTGADGKTTIPVMYGSADKQERLSAVVTKNGYKTGTGIVELQEKQVGKTITGPTIALEKQDKSGTVVTVNVIDAKTKEGIPGATVTLDGPGYHYDNTNGSGVASFVVPEMGTFEVRVSEENHRPFKTQVRVRSNEQDKPPVICEMEAKLRKDEGDDVIDVTVLWKDTTDESAKPAPLQGASVTAGSLTFTTDENGKVKLHGAFEEKQEVVVTAPGYKSQRRIVPVSKILHYSTGTGSASFTLVPELSENSPVRIIVKVEDAAGNKIEGAEVEFFSATGTSLGRSGTKGGEVDFRNSTAPSVPIADLRKGITVNVSKKPEYKDVLNRSVPANLLKPSLDAGTYIVQLDRDWTELEKAIGALEPKVAALKNEVTDAATKAKTADSLIAKFPAAKGRVEEILNELKQAEAAFKPEESAKRCEEAKTLAKQITDIQEETAKKEEAIKKDLDEAIGLSASCDSKAKADTIKTRFREAIKTAGEISKLTKKVSEPQQKLARMAEATKDGGTLKTQVEQALKKIESEVETAKKDFSMAGSVFVDAGVGAASIPNKRAALVSELEKLKKQFDLAKNDKLLPSELKARVTSLEQLLASISAPQSPSGERLEEVLKQIVVQLDQALTQARASANRFDKALCVVTPMDAEVEEINSHISGAMIELSAAADLEAKADECVRKLSSSPTPAIDEVTVPDVKGYTDPSKMLAAANLAGLKPSLVASREAPASDGAGVVVRQSPLANAKAKRGDTLTIFLSQKKVAAASPTPTPVVAATPSPNAGDEVIVPSIPSGATVAEAKATLSAAGLTAGFNAKGGKPGSKDLEFKTTGTLDPPAGSKAKRGSTVTVSIYQEYEVASSTPTASPLPSATMALGTMPNLIGLTLEQAAARLPSNMRIGSIDAGLKPRKPELAMTIFAQTPPAGTKIDPKNPPVVSVKQYGSAQSVVGTGPERFDGTYSGSYSGNDKGAVRFTVSGGVIAITSPGRGTGQISSSGSASINGSGADGKSNYTFSGMFSVGAAGKATASGKWTGTQSGFTGHGSWSAARR